MIVKNGQHTLILLLRLGSLPLLGYLCRRYPFTLLNVHIYNAQVMLAAPGVAPPYSRHYPLVRSDEKTGNKPNYLVISCLFPTFMLSLQENYNQTRPNESKDKGMRHE